MESAGLKYCTEVVLIQSSEQIEIFLMARNNVSLDNSTRCLIQQSMDQSMQGCISFAIAHCFPLITNDCCILSLKDERIIEQEIMQIHMNENSVFLT